MAGRGSKQGRVNQQQLGILQQQFETGCRLFESGQQPLLVTAAGFELRGKQSSAPPPPPRDDRIPGTDQAVRGGRHGLKLHSGFPPRQGDARGSAACHGRRFKGERPKGAATG